MSTITFLIIFINNLVTVFSYSNKLFTLPYLNSSNDIIVELEHDIEEALFGKSSTDSGLDAATATSVVLLNVNVSKDYPSGKYMRAETFMNKSSVHLPMFELLRPGYCHLRLTQDYMQTAVDAFAILVAGSVEDVKRLPAEYVLASARSIAMLKLSKDKLSAMWPIVRGSTDLDKLDIKLLERFRPLFKYVPGVEMAQLNLMDNKILLYIGTHPDLNRHQMGVVASRYIRLNRYWTSPNYLNMMNNLLCGVPMNLMRRIPQNTYLQLTHQVFYHIHACDPLQRKFYLGMMTKTQALGKPFSWGARDVSRLGLLLAEVKGQDLSAIDPRAMAGLTIQVMNEMPIENLIYLTEQQLRYINSEALNILARKLKNYRAKYWYSRCNLLKSSFVLIAVFSVLPIFLSQLYHY